MSLTRNEEEQIRKILDRAKVRSNKSATKSKRGFFKWLKGTSLAWLATKLLNLAWSTIRFLIFGF